MRATSTFLAGALLLALAGCSFRVAVRPPAPSEWPAPGHPVSAPERCTPALTPPVLDTIAMVLLLGLAYVERDAGSRWTPIALGVAAIPAGVSAGYGYVVATECRRYLRRFAPESP